MKSKLIEHSRFEEALTLAGLTFACFFLVFFRYLWTGQIHFLFLVWNLFLAAIPWFLTSYMVVNRVEKGVGFLCLVWLLFFPNAPYILTDLFHLRHRAEVPIWYDLILIIAFAWTGLLYGFFSLLDIEQKRPFALSQTLHIVFIVGLLFLSGFGIYIGRFLRWNSWDVVSHPLGILTDVFDRFVNPTAHPRTWGVTIFMGLLLNMMYFSIRGLRKNRKEN